MQTLLLQSYTSTDPSSDNVYDLIPTIADYFSKLLSEVEVQPDNKGSRAPVTASRPHLTALKIAWKRK